MNEELTEADRVWLRADWCNSQHEEGRKAVRIIDAHAADRAALVAQLEEQRASVLALAEERVRGLQAQVAELSRERNEARAELTKSECYRVNAESEVTRLTEALAAAERKCGDLGEQLERCSEMREFNARERNAAEARVRGLEAECTTLRVNNRVLEADNADKLERRRNAEKQLAAANALLRMHATQPLHPAVRAHLSAQPAAPGSVLSDGTWIRTPEEERGQPAAPVERAFYDGSCLKCGSAPVGGDHLCHECRPAAPTDHERAVLEAMGRVRIKKMGRDVWLGWEDINEVLDALRAELARREAKR